MSARNLLLAAAALAGIVACASEPPPRPAPRPAPVAARPKPARPAAPVDRSADVARELGVDPARLVWSPSRSAFAIALPQKLVVYGVSGNKRAEIDAARAAEISELRFLGEDRLAYLAPAPAPAPAPAHHKRHAARARPAAARATTTYVVQPLTGDTTAIACAGRSFVFSPAGDHLAFIAGDPGAEHVAVDGTQVYPRAGATRILGDPAWSRDGASLALIEGGGRPQLVVLVEFDNPNGDNSWPLPPQAADPSLRVFWAGAGNIVVGRELTRPVFATSFKRE